MSNCPECKATVEEGSGFCQECGAIIQRTTTSIPIRESFLGRVETNIYFKIARGFAWFIVFLSVIGLGFSILSLAPTAHDLWSGGDSKVTSDDIRTAMAAQQARGRQQPIEERIDPARL